MHGWSKGLNGDVLLFRKWISDITDMLLKIILKLRWRELWISHYQVSYFSLLFSIPVEVICSYFVVWYNCHGFVSDVFLLIGSAVVLIRYSAEINIFKGVKPEIKLVYFLFTIHMAIGVWFQPYKHQQRMTRTNLYVLNHNFIITHLLILFCIDM